MALLKLHLRAAILEFLFSWYKISKPEGNFVPGVLDRNIMKINDIYHRYLENPGNLLHCNCWGGFGGSDDGMNRRTVFTPGVFLSVHQTHCCPCWRQCWTATIKYPVPNGNIGKQFAAVVNFFNGKHHCLHKAKFSEIDPEKKGNKKSVLHSWTRNKIPE